MKSLTTLFARARAIIKEEGLSEFIIRLPAFLTGIFFRRATFYCYEHTMTERSEAEFLPNMTGFTTQILSTIGQYEELLSRGVAFSGQINETRKRLASGAIAFCILFGQEVAHISWIAPTKEAQAWLLRFPFRVDYAGGQVFTGGTFTIPKCRGMGLQVYATYKRYAYLWENGFKKTRNIVDIRNIAAQKANERFKPRIYARARYLKILGWSSWREVNG